MKNYKLNFLFASLLVLLFNSNLSAQWTISGETTAVCPGQLYKYTATPPSTASCGYGNCTPDWDVTQGGTLVRKDKFEAYVRWNNTTELG